MTPLRRILATTGNIALGIGVAACTPAAQTPTPPIDAPAATVPPAADISPLDEFIGHAVWNQQEEWQRAAEDYVLRGEQLIAQCMQQAGFTYQPDINSDNFNVSTPAFDDVHPNDWDWVSQYGFGVVSGHRSRSGGTIFDVRDDDPNQEYVESLTPTARAAFDYALRGPADNSTQLATHADWQEWMRSRGCWGQAVVQAQEENPIFLQQRDEWAPLFDAISAMWGTVVETPEWAALNQEWSNCMADAGFPNLSTPSDASGPLMSEYFGTTFGIQEQRHSGVLSDAEEAEIWAELQAREIDTALADFDCRQATNYESRQQAMQFAAETQFVADNRALLEDFRTATELGG